jgi:plasmid stabilization system protein ParE
MVKGIVWTSEAYSEFSAIVSYIQEEWGESSASKFVKAVMQKLHKLLVMPSIAKFTSRPGIQMYKLDKKNVLFFIIEDDYIVMLSIYPYKKDIKKSRYY